MSKILAVVLRVAKFCMSNLSSPLSEDITARLNSKGKHRSFQFGRTDPREFGKRGSAIGCMDVEPWGWKNGNGTEELEYKWSERGSGRRRQS